MLLFTFKGRQTLNCLATDSTKNVWVYIKVDTNADNVQVIICTDKVICTS